jgi:hypothetical protein
MKPVGISGKLVRGILRLMIVAYPLAIGTAIYLSVGRDWPWYESIPAGLGVLWATSMTWMGWKAAVLPG